MKVCFCGLGSIGRKHLANLLRLCEERKLSVEIHALRNEISGQSKYESISAQQLDRLLAKQVNDPALLDQDYDITFITNPSSLHYSTIAAMAGRTKHMFIEKPVFTDVNERVSDLNLGIDGIYYVAGPFRYSEVIRTLKNAAIEEQIYCARVICSSYLPDWRPETDYRGCYSAKKELGGGVALDLIHEWDYLTMIFGFPKHVFCMRGKYSHLEIDSEDAAFYIADYGALAVELHLDYFGRAPRREIELFTRGGNITGDLISHTVSFRGIQSETPKILTDISFQETMDDLYDREMKFFLDHILEKKPLNNVEASLRILGLALGKELP
ncbi:Gfo/Idh/MocA family protein [Anoxybacterium hadale]|uniref:Gfo/Idh/MocA family protein n=1 Tax=Anoxybacterium hadale TaxID=3408580 RepID=UPI003B00B29D